MIWLLLGVVPIVAFVIADSFLPQKTSIMVSVVLGLVVAGVTVWFSGFDYMLLIDIGLLVALGLVAIKLNNTRFFKLQPAIISFLLGLILWYYQVFHGGYMVHLLPSLKETLPLRMQQITETQEYLAKLQILEKITIVVCFLHGILMVWLSKKSTKAWIIGKVAAIPMILTVFILINLFT